MKDDEIDGCVSYSWNRAVQRLPFCFPLLLFFDAGSRDGTLELIAVITVVKLNARHHHRGLE